MNHLGYLQQLGVGMNRKYLYTLHRKILSMSTITNIYLCINQAVFAHYFLIVPLFLSWI
jgi:hypothetical protein